MSEERFEQEEAKDETEDVEAHRRKANATEEPGSEESDDVEAHMRRAAKHKES